MSGTTTVLIGILYTAGTSVEITRFSCESHLPRAPDGAAASLRIVAADFNAKVEASSVRESSWHRAMCVARPQGIPYFLSEAEGSGSNCRKDHNIQKRTRTVTITFYNRHPLIRSWLHATWNSPALRSGTSWTFLAEARSRMTIARTYSKGNLRWKLGNQFAQGDSGSLDEPNEFAFFLV